MTPPARADAIVVGAGIVGAACAAALAERGLRVTILDASFPGSGTTAAGMGHLVAMDDSPEQLALTSYSNGLWRALTPQLPPTVEMDWCGTLWIAADDAELAHVAAKQQAYAAVGVATEILDARALAEAEPNLRPLAGALRVPSDGVLYPPAAARWLVDQARARGATLRTGCTVDAIVDHGVRIGGETLHAETIVNAAGAAAARFIPELPIVPRKGHLVITDRYPGFVRHQLVELGYLASAHVMTNESVAFNVQPRRTGQVLIGSSRELVGWDASINPAILRTMLDRARRFMPALAEVSVIRTWTGFRPTTPDKLPLIGPWPSVPGLWIAAGHEGLGITTSLGSAALLADLVVGAQPAIDAAPFAPARVTDAVVVH